MPQMDGGGDSAVPRNHCIVVDVGAMLVLAKECAGRDILLVQGKNGRTACLKCSKTTSGAVTGTGTGTRAGAHANRKTRVPAPSLRCKMDSLHLTWWTKFCLGSTLHTSPPESLPSTPFPSSMHMRQTRNNANLVTCELETVAD